MRVKSRPLLKPSDDAHSDVVGGSTAKLRRLCAKSIDEEAKVPKEPAGPAADRGTALHHVCELTVKNSWSDERVIREFKGVVLRLDHMHYDIELTEKLLMTKALPACAFVDRTIHVDAEIWFEERMPFPGIPEGKGTSDLVFDQTFLTPKQLAGMLPEAGILDYKFGEGWIVDAHDNDQMRFYLVSAIAKGLLPELPEYTAYIFQPADKVPQEKHASRGVYTREDLQEFAADLVDAIDTWRAGRAKHVTGEHCNHCRGKIACGPYKAMLTQAMGTDIKGMSSAELARWMDMLPGLAAFSKGIYAATLRNVQARVNVPGWKTTAGLSDRKFKDAAKAAKVLRRLGVPQDVVFQESIISAPQALEQLKIIGTPADELAKFERDHIERTETGERLVRKEKGEAEPPPVSAKVDAWYKKHQTKQAKK